MTDDSNGRVTLAVIGMKIDGLSDRIDKLCQQVGEHEGRLRSTERWCDTSTERWRTHEETHKTERGLTTVLGGIAAAVASAIGVFVQKP